MEFAESCTVILYVRHSTFADLWCAHPVRLFALSRMVDVLHYNMNRIYDLWGIFLSHVLEVLASPKPALRNAAMEAVGTAINGALAEPASPAEPAAADNSAAALGRDSADSFERGVEHMLLVALTALYSDDRDMDVRLGVLRVAITVLQRHGAPVNRQSSIADCSFAGSGLDRACSK